jgi:enoyl-[acyl-carrier protein] reductase III
MIDLSGKVALITGSSRGIGRSCALRLAGAGADIAVNYLTSRQAAEETAREAQRLGRRAVVVKADVSERDDVQTMIDFLRQHFGRLDIVVSNAASGGFRPLLATTERHLEAAYNTNVRPLLYLAQAALPLLERQAGEPRSKIIALSSHGSHRALPMYGTIGTTKAALESLVRHLALEIGVRGVNVNIVQAGLVQTDSFQLMPQKELVLEKQRTKNLVGDRALAPEDVADAVLYLSSPLSDMVQGQTLVVDAGAAITM